MATPQKARTVCVSELARSGARQPPHSRRVFVDPAPSPTGRPATTLAAPRASGRRFGVWSGGIDVAPQTHERRRGHIVTETPLHGPDPALDSTAQQWVQACVRWCGMDGATVVVGLGAAGPPSTHGRAVVYSTDPVASAVADLQFVLGCGPHRHAMTENTIGFAKVGDTHDRWPLLTAELSTIGVRSVCSAPLMAHDVGAQLPLGTLQLHSAQELSLIHI